MIIAGGIASFVTFLLKSRRGKLEFSALGIKFSGPSGPTLLWAVIFVVVCVAITALG